MKGFFFLCSNATEKECLDKMLFATKDEPNRDYVFEIKSGDIGFLYHYEIKMLYGVFEAVTDGRINIDKGAFGGRFPRQVRVKYKNKSHPLSKSQLEALDFLDFIPFKWDKSKDFIVPLILTEDQTKRLIELFETEETGEEVKSPFDPRKALGAIRTDDGHWVRSRGEAMIDSWLFNHNITHAYERRIPFIEERIFPDFYIPKGDCYIEYWGLDDEKYLNIKEWKKSIYEKYKINVVGIDNDDINNIDDVLPEKLKPFLKVRA